MTRTQGALEVPDLAVWQPDEQHFLLEVQRAFDGVLEDTVVVGGPQHVQQFVGGVVERGVRVGGAPQGRGPVRDGVAELVRDGADEEGEAAGRQAQRRQQQAHTRQARPEGHAVDARDAGLDVIGEALQAGPQIGGQLGRGLLGEA